MNKKYRLLLILPILISLIFILRGFYFFTVFALPKHVALFGADPNPFFDLDRYLYYPLYFAISTVLLLLGGILLWVKGKYLSPEKVILPFSIIVSLSIYLTHLNSSLSAGLVVKTQMDIILNQEDKALEKLREKIMEKVESVNKSQDEQTIDTNNDQDLTMANPASDFCKLTAGEWELVTSPDGSQFGICNLGEYSCEEWTYYRGECDVERMEQLIMEALRNKGLNLSGMRVKINIHMGKYIGGSVVPIDSYGGGGYVFAVKEGESVKVLADGNGAIMCAAFNAYPDFPAYLVSQCVDSEGNIKQR